MRFAAIILLVSLCACSHEPPAAAPAPAKPVTAAPAVKAPAAPAPAAPAAAGGSSGVQIGAFSSTAIADREYAAVASRFGQYASGAEKRVQEVTAANGSTVYRTTFTGMSRERAVAFCNALKAAGRDCIVR
jgi:cell division protein FtsN